MLIFIGIIGLGIILWPLISGAIASLFNGIVYIASGFFLLDNKIYKASKEQRRKRQNYINRNSNSFHYSYSCYFYCYHNIGIYHGLPSGTLWASYDFGTSVGFNTAYYRYRKHLPSKSDTEELRKNCTKEWLPETHTLKLTGPNGNTIYFRIIDKHISYWLNLYEELNDLGQCFHLFQDKSFHINDMPCSNPGKLRFVKRISKQELKEKTEPTLFDTIDN